MDNRPVWNCFGDIVAKEAKSGDYEQAIRMGIHAVTERIMVNAGYSIENTGGGCEAWTKPLANGGYVLITCELSVYGSNDLSAKEWQAGEYDAEGNPALDTPRAKVWDGMFTLAEALIETEDCVLGWEQEAKEDPR